MRYDNFTPSSYREALFSLGVPKIVTKAKAAKSKSKQPKALAMSEDQKALNRDAARKRYTDRKNLRLTNQLHESPEKVRDFAKAKSSEAIEDLEF